MNEDFYIQRIKTLMKFHSRMILDDKNLNANQKRRQMQIVEQILDVLPKEREVQGDER